MLTAISAKERRGQYTRLLYQLVREVAIILTAIYQLVRDVGNTLAAIYQLVR